MKKHINSIIFVFVALAGLLPQLSVAQDNDFRKMAPEAGPAREIEIGTYESFELPNGLKVIVVENHKFPRISYQLYIDRDNLVEGKKAGVTSVTGDLLSRGTTSYTKAQIDEAVDFVGGSLNTNSRGGFASSLTKHTDVVLELLADVILKPTFPEEEFEKIKTQTLSGLQTQKDDPNAISNNVSNALIYGLDHPYGEMMTETTLESVTVEDCKQYYSTYFKPNISYLVVVGDISPKDAKHMAEKYFGSWERGDVPTFEYDFPKLPEATQVDFVDKAGAVQSVINITNPVDLEPGSPDVIPSRVMNTILGSGFSGRLFRNLREDKAYTYGAYSNLSSDELVGDFSASASVRNEVTDSAVTEFLYELNKLRDEPVTDDELLLAKSYIAGAFARNLESPQTVAGFALNTYLYDLPADYYNKYLEKLAAVNKEDVQAMAQKYIMPDKARIVVVGNQDEVSESLAQFDKEDGEVTFYDIYANEKKPAMDAGDITGRQVVEQYIAAIGGMDAIESVKSLKQEMSTSLMGQTMEVVVQQMAPDKFSMVMSMPGMVVMKQVYDGEQGYVEQMGQKMALEGSDLDQMKHQAQIVPELDLLSDEYNLEVNGVEDVNGEMAYKVTAKDGNDESTVYFFGKDSGLKLKMVSSQEANGQSITITQEFSDYKEVGGIKIPYTSKTMGMMPTPIEMKTSNVEVNPEIDSTVFE